MMHAGAVEGQAAFTAQGIIAGQKNGTGASEDSDQQFGQELEKEIECPAIVAEEAMEAAPVAVTDLATGEDAFGDEPVSGG
jgi:hypothetical protein